MRTGPSGAIPVLFNLLSVHWCGKQHPRDRQRLGDCHPVELVAVHVGGLDGTRAGLTADGTQCNGDRLMGCDRCPCPTDTPCLAWDAFCEWAAEEPQDPVRIATIRNRSILAATGELPDVRPAIFRAPLDPTAPKPCCDGQRYPSIATQAVTAARAAARFAASGFALTSDVEIRQRLAICHGCDHYDASQDRCFQCGCAISLKIKMASESCPLTPPKWGPGVDTSGACSP